MIECLKISPLNARFSDHPGHRDYLGALMNLGIERDRIGDILVRGDTAFVFVLRAMAGTIAADLTSVRHTTVRCAIADPGTADLAPHFREVTGSVASERLDALLSMAWHLSRTTAKALVEAEQVYADGRLVTDAGRQVRAGTRVSVRGKGKFIYDGMQARSRKDRLMVTIRIYE